MIDLKELAAKFEKRLLREKKWWDEVDAISTKISGTDYLLYDYGGDSGIMSDEGGAIVFFKNKAAAISAAKTAKKSGLYDWMERGMDADVAWGANKKETQSDMKDNWVDDNIIKTVVGTESGEGIG